MFYSARIRLSTVRSCIQLERGCENNVFHCRKFSEKAQAAVTGVYSSPESDQPDKFGTLSQPKNKYQFVEPTKLDKLEAEKMEKKLSRPYNHDIKCAMQIKALLKERKVSEALSILDSGEIAKPDGYVYGLLIKACGSVGYTKKAFKLYNEMKKRGIKPRPSVYTSLFNACSNSPWKEDTLSRATYLLNSLEGNGYEPNDINYNAMIKAFGRGGDLTRAFSLVDQMLDRGIGVSSSTFAFLLQACVSDKEAGFRHAVIVWDKMRKNGINPSVYTYNLLLRCCKECGCGDGIEISKLSGHDSIIQIPGRTAQKALPQRRDILTLPVELTTESLPPNSSVRSETTKENEGDVGKAGQKVSPPEDEVIVVDMRSNQENNLNKFMVDVANNYLKPVTPEERLLTLGGLDGFLKQMANKGVRPSIKTFTQLLDVIPPNEEAEKKLILAIEENNLEKDIEFCNMLMKKRTIRLDYDGAKAVIPMITTAGLTPNIMTFGILAMGCKNKNETKAFVSDVKGAGFRLNAEIMGSLIRSACRRWEIFHVMELMDLCIKEEVRANARLLQHLQEFKDQIRNAVKEERVTDSVQKSKKVSERAYQTYNSRLSSWLKEVDTSEAQEEHPWTQFRRHFKKEEVEGSKIST
ncbi:pentatricopeptide repeat-containing protein 1, mitochondrial [Ischnura elegans]|uniref:pentatricopeptide repeat-containing protein 1, mitochondrial n=1 Tax=Ischnura elegans TaxID=197161 RepID=UPI001ED8B8B3|nr:pentatricopeptide repeat-containing protein 1, mitochondrial [Ischnura elegans]